MGALVVLGDVLHAIGTVVAPASGAALFTGQTGLETDLPTLAAILLGAGTGRVDPRRPLGGPPSVHRDDRRPRQSVLSALEDLDSLGLISRLSSCRRWRCSPCSRWQC
jgi:hypothetical protein